MRNITVNASKEYPVLIDGGLLTGTGEKIASACGGDKAMLVTDDIVDKLYGEAVAQSLHSAKYETVKFTFPHGEQSKNMGTYNALINALAEADLTRADVIVALGGGVVGDMAGFAAATYLRGVRFAQIPTTLLAMVDSSVGGKTGVNLSSGKNRVGAFFQPDIVICDYDVLRSLPDHIFRDGCAEMVKHGVIRCPELFELLKKPLQDRMEDVIARNVTIKRDVVAADERDVGVRQILNFGHTIGHGVEKHSGYGVSHGKAVSIGMSIASRGAYRMGFCDEGCHLEITGALEYFQLPTETGISADKLIEAAFSDKKRRGQGITLILPERIGKCVMKGFSLDEAAEFIRLGMEV